MHLYALTLQAGSIQCLAHGNFSGPSHEEIVVARGNTLELLRATADAQLVSIHRASVFATVRTLAAFRLSGQSRDCVVVNSDSGRVALLRFDEKTSQFVRVHCENVGKSGCRRIVPGQYLAVDPAGRAIMTAAVEKQKLVFVMNRDAEDQLTISSPLEAHKSHSIVFDMVAADVGYDNPVFVALELSYEAADEDPSGTEAENAEKMLVVYELDLGLNNVVRKMSEVVDRSAHKLVPVPGGEAGPGGVLVCSQGKVAYRSNLGDAPDGDGEIEASIPQRVGKSAVYGSEAMIVAAAVHRQPKSFIILLQNELGDIFEAKFHSTSKASGASVKSLELEYFDTVPTARAMCITRNGLLFLAADSGDHLLFAISDGASTPAGVGSGSQQVVLRKLQNLELVYEMDSLAPCLDTLVHDLAGEMAPQIYALCGRAGRSSLKALRSGLEVTELAVTELPGHPSAVWTVKGGDGDQGYDKYIVVSFANATLVLSIGESVEEVNNSGLNTMASTVCVGLLHGSGDMCQVCAHSIRQVAADGALRHEWAAPGGKVIKCASMNGRQVIVALSGGEVVYFELDASHVLAEAGRTNLGIEASCIDVGPVPAGRVRSEFVAVGCWDQTVRIFSLHPDHLMDSLSVQGLPDRADTVCLLLMGGAMYLNIGLDNGVLVRTQVEETGNSGALFNTRTRLLGARAVRCVRVGRGDAMLALSTRPWLWYNHQNRAVVSPLSYPTLEHAATFSSEACPDGYVAVSGKTLRVFALERLGETFNTQSVRLQHTPRRAVVHPKESGAVIVIEGDQGALPLEERTKLLAEATTAPPAGSRSLRKRGRGGGNKEDESDGGVDGGGGAGGDGGGDGGDSAEGKDEDDEDEGDMDGISERRVGAPRTTEAGRWCGAVRIMNVAQWWWGTG